MIFALLKHLVGELPSSTNKLFFSLKAAKRQGVTCWSCYKYARGNPKHSEYVMFEMHLQGPHSSRQHQVVYKMSWSSSLMVMPPAFLFGDLTVVVQSHEASLCSLFPFSNSKRKEFWLPGANTCLQFLPEKKDTIEQLTKIKLSLNGIVALLATTAAAFPLIEDDADMIKSFPLSRRQVDKVPRAAIFHAFNDTDCKSFEMEARFEAPRPELKNRITCVNLGNAQVASLKALFLKDGCSSKKPAHPSPLLLLFLPDSWM